MPKKIIGLTVALIIACGLVLSGCGYRPNENSSEYAEFTSLRKLSDKLWKMDGHIGDYTYGDENSGRSIINPEYPIYKIYVNPVATDEVMDMYVKLAQDMESVLMENREYVKFLKSGNSYYITFECHGTRIYDIALDGKIDADSLKEALYENMQGIRDEVSTKLEQHFAYIDTLDVMNKDSEGDYYVIIDSNNVTESLNELIKELRTVKEYNPISADEANHYMGSVKYMGYIDGSYKIYADSYGIDFVDNSTGEQKEIRNEFSFPIHYIYIWIYNTLIDMADYKDESRNIKIDYSFTKYGNLTEHLAATIMADIDDDTYEYTQEEVTQAFYDFYLDLLNKCDKYGIVYKCELDLCGQYNIPNDDIICGISGSVPMNEDITYEEFASRIEFTEQYYYTGMYNLGDDCL